MGKGNIADREFFSAEGELVSEFREYFDRFTEICVSEFEYENMPDTIDVRYYELALFYNGKSIVFRDEALGMLALRMSDYGRFNIYNIPIQRRAFANNGYNKELTDQDSVIIYNNKLRTNSVSVAYRYAKRLAMIDKTIDININAQKTPLLITCEEKDKQTMKNLYMKYDGGFPFIFAKKNQVTPNSIQVMNTEAPFLAEQLYELKQNIWNEALTYLGITNVNVQKKERMISDEVIRGQGGTLISRESRLQMRQECWDKVNKMFGLNVKVKFKEPEIADDKADKQKEDNDNESVHDKS